MTNVSQPFLLPPANEVWGKVMFLHLSVSHSVHRGSLGLCPVGSLSGGLCPEGVSVQGVLCPGEGLSGEVFVRETPVR